MDWIRILAYHTVLASLEAVAFAAVGALFGTTIQRQRVADAKKQAHGHKDRRALRRGAAADAVAVLEGFRQTC